MQAQALLALLTPFQFKMVEHLAQKEPLNKEPEDDRIDDIDEDFGELVENYQSNGPVDERLIRLYKLKAQDAGIQQCMEILLNDLDDLNAKNYG